MWGRNYRGLHIKPALLMGWQCLWRDGIHSNSTWKKNTDAQVSDLDWERQQCMFPGSCFLTQVKQTQAFVAWASGDIINCGNCGPLEQPWPRLTWVPRQWSQSAWPRQKWGRSRWCRTWRWMACCCARGPCRSERSWLSSEADHQVHTHVTHSK